MRDDSRIKGKERDRFQVIHSFDLGHSCIILHFLPTKIISGKFFEQSKMKQRTSELEETLKLVSGLWQVTKIHNWSWLKAYKVMYWLPQMIKNNKRRTEDYMQPDQRFRIWLLSNLLSILWNCGRCIDWLVQHSSILSARLPSIFQKL